MGGSSRVLRVLVTVVAVAVFGGGCSINARADARRIDQLQDEFEANPQVFEDAAAVMARLVAEADDAVRVGLTLSLVCVLPPGYSDPIRDDECRETTPAEKAVFSELPNTELITYQARDGNRFIFHFDLRHPPVFHIMYAPDDDDPGGFANDRKFRSHRSLTDDWTILGPIGSLEDRKAQWVTG